MSDGAKRVGAAVLVAVLAAVGVSVATAASSAKRVKEVTAKLKSPTGKTVGTATFEQGRGSAVDVEVTAKGLTRGFHGFHVHAKGVCASPWPPLVTNSGRVSELVTGDGSAVMIHAGPDNAANIPARYKADGQTVGGPDAETLKTGDSGARAACGVAKAGG